MKDRLLAKSGGDRQFVRILNAMRTDGTAAVADACEAALQAKAVSADYVLNVLSRSRPGAATPTVIPPQPLALREPPRADLSRYDELLKKSAGKLTLIAVMAIGIAGAMANTSATVSGVEHAAP